MLKKILFLLLLLISTFTFSQKNDIKIYPTSMEATSGIILTVEKKGYYNLKILNFKEELLFTRKVLIEKVFAFKHNFSNYENGKYIFILEKNNKELFKVSKIK